MFDIPNAIRACMYEKHISQSELSRRTGMRPDSICKVLGGQRRLLAEEYILICRALSISTEELRLRDPALIQGLTLRMGGVE